MCYLKANFCAGQNMVSEVYSNDFLAFWTVWIIVSSITSIGFTHNRVWRKLQRVVLEVAIPSGKKVDLAAFQQGTFDLSFVVVTYKHRNGIEILLQVMPLGRTVAFPNALVAVSRSLWPVKLCCKKTRSIWKMLGPFTTVSRFTPIHQVLPAVLSRAACTLMSMTSTTITTMRDRGDRYGPMEWAQ